MHTLSPFRALASAATDSVRRHGNSFVTDFVCPRVCRALQEHLSFFCVFPFALFGFFVSVLSESFTPENGQHKRMFIMNRTRFTFGCRCLRYLCSVRGSSTGARTTIEKRKNGCKRNEWEKSVEQTHLCSSRARPRNRCHGINSNGLGCYA